jgi:hypothetical protein
MSPMRSLASTIREMLQEIFDESAYARFLERESKVASASAYAEFVQEKYSAPIRRCC